MGKYRTDLLLAATASPSASGTRTIDLDISQPISRIEITYKTTKASEGMSAPAPANIPKVELVEGSTPLHSLTGYTNQALAYYSRNHVAMEHGQHIGSLSEVDMYVIDFGRFLWDPLYAFDPKRFKNPQLKITYNRAVSDTSVTVDSMEIWAHVFDEKTISPMGFLKAIEVWSGSFLADNSVNEILLPEDEVIRQLLVRAHYDGYEPWYQVDIAKLDEAANGHVIFDYQDLEMFYRRMKSQWPMLQVPLQIAPNTSSGRYYYIAPSDYYAGINMIPIQATGELYMGGAGAKGGKVNPISNTAVQYVGRAFGYLPWSTFQFALGDQQNPDDWYDPAGKKPRLRLTSNTAGTSGDGNVVIETVKKY